MTVLITRNAPMRTRGFLASCMCEVAPGVYVGARLSSAVRDRVWNVMEKWFDPSADASIVMIWPDTTKPGGQAIETLGVPRLELAEHDGVFLARREDLQVSEAEPG